jgi:hypothetical protein
VPSRLPGGIRPRGNPIHRGFSGNNGIVPSGQSNASCGSRQRAGACGDWTSGCEAGERIGSGAEEHALPRRREPGRPRSTRSEADSCPSAARRIGRERGTARRRRSSACFELIHDASPYHVKNT